MIFKLLPYGLGCLVKGILDHRNGEESKLPSGLIIHRFAKCHTLHLTLIHASYSSCIPMAQSECIHSAAGLWARSLGCSLSCLPPQTTMTPAQQAAFLSPLLTTLYASSWPQSVKEVALAESAPYRQERWARGRGSGSKGKAGPVGGTRANGQKIGTQTNRKEGTNGACTTI